MQADEAGFFKNRITSKADKQRHQFLFWVDKVALITIRLNAFFFIFFFVLSVIIMCIAIIKKQTFQESMKPVLPKAIAKRI